MDFFSLCLISGIGFYCYSNNLKNPLARLQDITHTHAKHSITNDNTTCTCRFIVWIWIVCAAFDICMEMEVHVSITVYYPPISHYESTLDTYVCRYTSISILWCVFYTYIKSHHLYAVYFFFKIEHSKTLRCTFDKHQTISTHVARTPTIWWTSKSEM